jgi:U3 small nucleolar RNA-associated protein 23
MRINRTKVVRKCLKFFRIIYNIQDPYDIILDFNFIVDCFKYKIDIHDRIIKLLQCKAIHLYILKSSYTQLTQLPHHQEEYLNFVSTLCTILEDSHLGGEEGSWRIIAFQRLIQSEYMESSVKNKCKRYMVATQDADIRNELRKIPGVPILYSNKVTLVLETPSDASKNFNMKVTNTYLALFHYFFYEIHFLFFLPYTIHI